MAYRVVIIGGGASGCAAADRLAALLPASDVSITLVEASDRIGGRTLSVPLASHPGTSIDLGGQWIGARQDVALQLVRELGLTLVPQYHAGKRVLALGDVIRTYTGLIPNASWSVLVDAQLTLALIACLRLLLWLLPASALARWADGTSVAQLSARVMWTAGARALVRIVVQGLFGVEPEDLSLNAFCRYLNASGGVEPMTEVGPGTLQCWTVLGGTQQLSQGLLARAGPARVTTLLGHKVTGIRHARSSASTGAGAAAPITLTCLTGLEIAADFVVMALPPSLAHSIAFSPPLDPGRTALLAGARMGGIIKACAVYDTAFWRAEGFSGEAIADTASDSLSPVFNTFDNCLPPSAGTPSQPLPAAGPAAGIPLAQPTPHASAPALVLFINGARALEWSSRPAEERKGVVLAQLARWFGPRALSPVEYVEKDWVADPYTRGCPIASYPAALLTEYGLPRALGEACWPLEAGGAAAGHRVHWAGTEAAVVGTGFIDGALRAGQAAAEGVAFAVASVRRGEQEGGRGGGLAGLPPLLPQATLNPTAVSMRQVDRGLAEPSSLKESLTTGAK